jgi:NADH dehydrogenase
MAPRHILRDALPVIGLGLAAFALARVARQRRDAPGHAGVGGRCRVVVVGAGFGGLSAALTLSRSPAVDLTLIDAQNHHLFQPLLYQVATSSLSPADIAHPVRDIIPALPRTHVMMGAVTGIDTAARHVLCDGRRVRYDELIIATGSRTSYFGHDDWVEFAPGLKTLHDALDLRARILLAFERACNTDDPAERARQLTFVLIGAGPAGVEMAGSIAELSRETMAQDHELSHATPRIILIEAGKRVLAEFAADVSAYAAGALGRLGVEVRTGARVTGMEAGAVHLDNETIRAGTIFWAAGMTATPVAEWLGVAPAHGGKVEVAGDLSVPGCPGVRVIGDAALAKDSRGKTLPGLAPVAKQQGAYAAQAILRALARRPASPPFRYRDYGTLATIGRARAVAQFGPVHITGLPAWGLWAVAHIFFLIGFRNRLMVSGQWAFAFATDRRPGRLIAGPQPTGKARPRLAPAARQPPVAKPG